MKTIEPIKASAILAYVIKHKKPYPLATEQDVDNDLPGDIHFDAASFCTITKSRFAREAFEVEPSQVSRWIAGGMSVTASQANPERLCWRQALEWLQANRSEWWNQRKQAEAERVLARLQALGYAPKEPINPITADE